MPSNQIQFFQQFLAVLKNMNDNYMIICPSVSFSVQFDNDQDVTRALQLFNQLERIDLKFILKCQRVTITSVEL